MKHSMQEYIDMAYPYRLEIDVHAATGDTEVILMSLKTARMTLIPRDELFISNIDAVERAIKLLKNALNEVEKEEINKILATEYSEKFDKIRRDMMCMSYYKYGPVKDNYSTHKVVNAIKSLKIRLEAYEATGNTEYLADIANFAMIEFMYPQHMAAKYIPTDSTTNGPRIAGMSVNEIKAMGDGQIWQR